MSRSDDTKGLMSGIFAFGFWGFVPLFWKQIKAIPPYEIMSFRVVCSLLVIVLLLLFRKELTQVLLLMKEKTFLVILSALLIGSNWLVYVWAVNNDHIVETSLGYFINPLMNVFLGVVFLGERLRPAQWASVSLAFSGVTYLSFQGVGKPWIALLVASTFALYGLVRKKMNAKSLVGLGAENLLILPIGLGYLIYLGMKGEFQFSGQTNYVQTLTLLSGLATVFPLTAFGVAVKHLSLTTLGLIQYLAPISQLLIGVMIYNEPFSSAHKVTFSLIWIALGIYTFEALFYKHVQTGKIRTEKKKAVL